MTTAVQVSQLDRLHVCWYLASAVFILSYVYSFPVAGGTVVIVQLDGGAGF